MSKLTKVLFGSFAALCLVSCSKSAKLIDIAKEEGVANAASWGVDSVLKYIDIDYALSLMEENRVHSVNSGKGVKVVINDWKSNVILSVAPLGGLGKKRRLYENTRVFPGDYLLTANIGTSSLKISLLKDVTYDFYKIAKALQADASQARGRLKLEVSPADATIVIYGTPHKYHEGIKLPEGSYEVKVTKLGYEEKRFSVLIAKGSLTTKEITLQRASPGLPEQLDSDIERVEVISVTGSRNETERRKEDSNVYGKLTILPQREDILYSVKDTQGMEHEVEPLMVLPEGNYRVTAKRASTGEAIASKPVSVERTKQHRVVFSIPELPYQHELAVSLTFTSDSLHRQRAEIRLVPNEGETIIIRKRMGRRGLDIDTVLMNGEYTAELTAGGIQYDLGLITIVKDKSNRFEFVLK